MTEQEWLTCDDPQAMWSVAGESGRINLRAITDGAGLTAAVVTTGESLMTWMHGDDGLPFCDLIREIVGNPWRPVVVAAPMRDHRLIVVPGKPHLAAWIGKHQRPLLNVLDSQKPLSPFTTVKGVEAALLDPDVFDWKDGAIPRTAQAIHDGRQGFDAMPILADMLEEAGCQEGSILDHLRGTKKCAWCEGAGHFPATFKVQIKPPFVRPGMRNGVIVDECERCEGKGVRQAKHAKECWCLELFKRK